MTVTVTPTGGGASISQSATTDSSGAWHLRFGTAIPDGTYTVDIHAVDKNGATQSGTPSDPDVPGDLQIDTARRR